jgi:pyruvate,water dikinase
MRKVLAEGIGACRGRARGRAVVILPGTQNDFHRGDVLVIPSMLFGDWLPYIRQAAAVVTDKGGRRSHAAVAACEFGVPCIVGTRNGTATIKSGTQVLVDATHGQVLSEEEEDRPAAQPSETAGPTAQAAGH